MATSFPLQPKLSLSQIASTCFQSLTSRIDFLNSLNYSNLFSTLVGFIGFFSLLLFIITSFINEHKLVSNHNEVPRNDQIHDLFFLAQNLIHERKNNIAENELSAMTQLCLAGRRMGDIETLKTQISAWSGDVHGKQRGVDWQMKIGNARVKLKSVYPKINV